jgi:hypothetical protein
VITQQELEGMRLGDTFLAGGILRGVTDEPTVLKLVEIGASDYVFKITYFGIDMGEVAVMIRKNQVTVEHL